MESRRNAVDVIGSDHQYDDDDGTSSTSSSSSRTIGHPSMTTGESNGSGFLDGVPEDRKFCNEMDEDDGELRNKENRVRGRSPSQQEKRNGFVEGHMMHRPSHNANAQSGTTINHHDHFTARPLIAEERDRIEGMASMGNMFAVGAALLEQRGLLFAGKKRGYWVHSEDVSPHRPSNNWDGGRSTSGGGWCDGQILLQANLPTVQQGWVVLPSAEIPSGPPISEPLYSWEDYAEARSLARSSVAPLLLTSVLTIYHMLFNVLQLADRAPVNAEKCRHTGFLVYVLGAKWELNHLPIFEELVYLIGGMDLELRFISPAVKSLMDKARRHFPASHLMMSGDYVLDKEGVDGSRLRISFELDDVHFHELVGTSSFFRPDAVVALNAGIRNDGDWEKTIIDLFWDRTPFCFSGATKHELRAVKDILIPKMTQAHFEQRLESGAVVTPRCPNVELSENPFHGATLHQRGVCMIPAISNGYLLSYQGGLW